MDITEVLMEERMDFRILNNGSFIPSIGYGTYKTGSEGETEQAVTNALNVGYRYLIQPPTTATKRPLAEASKHLVLNVLTSLLPQKFGIPTQATIIQCVLLKAP